MYMNIHCSRQQFSHHYELVNTMSLLPIAGAFANEIHSTTYYHDNYNVRLNVI